MHPRTLTLLGLAALAGACSPPKMVVASAHVPATEPDGTVWDSDGSPPDCYVFITRPDDPQWFDDTVDEQRTSYDPVFTDMPETEVHTGDMFAFELRDWDYGFITDGYDRISTCDAMTIDDAMLTAGTYTCGDYGTITIDFE